MCIGLKRGTVYLEEHRKCWEENAKQTIVEIQKALNGLGADVQHIGSTSIKSIKAKPIIDIVVGAANYDTVIERNSQLKKFGIIFRLDERPKQLLYVKGNFKSDIRTHHIHVVLKDSKEWNNYLNFRDYLNYNKTAAFEYETIKQRMAELYPNDRDAYTEGKREVVCKLLRDAEKWKKQYLKLMK